MVIPRHLQATPTRGITPSAGNAGPGNEGANQQVARNAAALHEQQEQLERLQKPPEAREPSPAAASSSAASVASGKGSSKGRSSRRAGKDSLQTITGV